MESDDRYKQVADDLVENYGLDRERAIRASNDYFNDLSTKEWRDTADDQEVAEAVYSETSHQPDYDPMSVDESAFSEEEKAQLESNRRPGRVIYQVDYDPLSEVQEEPDDDG